MDNQTKRALLWTEIWSFFQPLTPMGQQAKRSLPPFLPGQEREWRATLAEQERLRQAVRRDGDWGRRMESVLSRVPEIRPVLSRLERGGVPGVSEWFGLKQFLWQARSWRRLLEQQGLDAAAPSPAEERELLERLNPVPPLQPSFSLEDTDDERLRELRRKREELERSQRQRGEEAVLEMESEYGIRRNRDGEWVVDRRSPVAARLEADERIRKVRETPFDVVYVRIPAAEEREAAEEAERLATRIEEVEFEVLSRLALFFRKRITILEQMVADLCRFDLQWARMRAAERWSGCRPVHSPKRYRIRGGIHPVVAGHLKGRRFTPVDLDVEPGATVIIGPNMGGKTVALKTLGLIAALAQYGFFVPARSCELPLVPWITGVIGDDQDAAAGLSTFGAEVARMAEVLKHREGGLLLLDEIGRGTNPAEGAALSAAVTSHLTRSAHWSVHVTHYREVIKVNGIRAYRVSGLPDTDIRRARDREAGDWEADLQSRMDYRLVPLAPGETIPRQALAVAQCLGLPEPILREARRRLQGEADPVSQRQDEESTRSV